MAHDTARRTIVLFGGYSSSSGYLSDTWEYLSSPTLTQQPVAQAACQGGSATFTAAASGSEPLMYHWRRGAVNLTDGGNVTGAASAALTINPATLGDAAPDYNLVITNTAGSITTYNVALAVYVTATGDANTDGVLDGQDIVPFVNYLLTGGSPTSGFCAADMNADALLDAADIQPFVNALTSP